MTSLCECSSVDGDFPFFGGESTLGGQNHPQMAVTDFKKLRKNVKSYVLCCLWKSKLSRYWDKVISVICMNRAIEKCAKLLF